MNILILNWKDIRNPTSGGAEIVTFEHARRWVSSGHKVTWLCSSYKHLPKKEKIDGIEIIRFGNIYTIYFFAPLFYLFGSRKFELIVDEVHGIPFFTPFYVRKPIVVLIHEIAGGIWDIEYTFPLNWIGKFLEKKYLKLYSNKKFWTDSEFTLKELTEKGIDKKNCLSIPCPSSLNSLAKIPIKNKNISIISINRLVKMKGIEDVIRAFSILQKKYKNSTLDILGDGDENYIKELKNVVKNLKLVKNVNFLGYVSAFEKEKLLKKSHLLFHASIKEGWGIVVMEAASQATPSIVYNVPGLSESVINNQTGIVLNKNTPERMANQSIILLKDGKRYKKFQINGLEWSRSLTWDNAASQSLKFLKKEFIK